MYPVLNLASMVPGTVCTRVARRRPRRARLPDESSVNLCVMAETAESDPSIRAQVREDRAAAVQ